MKPARIHVLFFGPKSWDVRACQQKWCANDLENVDPRPGEPHEFPDSPILKGDFGQNKKVAPQIEIW